MGTPDPRPAIACTGAAAPPTADGDKVPGRGVVSRCFLNRLASIPPHGALQVITWRDTGCARGVVRGGSEETTVALRAQQTAASGDACKSDETQANQEHGVDLTPCES